MIARRLLRRLLAGRSVFVLMCGVEFGAVQLRDKALAALEEAAEQSKNQPLVRTKALSFALAYLWAYGGGERWPFVNFWRAIAGENDIGRSQGVNASLNAIYLALGLKRT